MARSFSGAADNHLTIASALLSGVPMTLAAWVYATDLSTDYHAIQIGTNGTFNHVFTLVYEASSSRMTATTRATSSRIAYAPTTLATGTWAHICGVFESSVSRTCYQDGVPGTTAGGSSVPSGLDETNIGIRADGAVPWQGRIAEAAIWNIVLNAQEVAALAAGMKPGLIRPDALVGYWPLYGVSSPEQDASGNGNHMPVFATTRVDHPPKISTFTPVRRVRSVAAVGTLYEKDLSDSVSLMDSVDTSKVTIKSLADSASVADAIVRAIARPIIDSIGLADSIDATKVATKSLSDSIAIGDTGNLWIARTISDPVGLSDSAEVTKLTYKSVADTVSLSDSMVRAATKAPSDSASLVDSISRNLTRSIVDSAVLTDSANLTKVTSKSVGDSIALSDSSDITKVTIKSLVDAVSVADSISRAIGKTLSDTIAPDDAITRALVRSMGDSATLTDSVQATTDVTTLNLSDSMSVSDSVSTEISLSNIPTIFTKSAPIAVGNKSRIHISGGR